MPLSAPTKFGQCPRCRGTGRSYTGAYLRTLRLDAGISLRRMAERVGCSPTYLSYVEREDCRVTAKLAEHYFALVDGKHR